MKQLLTVALLLCFCQTLAQQDLSDSLQRRLKQPIADTIRVQVLDQLSRSLMYSNPLVAMQYAQQGLKLARQTSNHHGEARILNRIGTIFRLTGNYDRSLEAHLNSISIAQAIGDIDALARTYNNMGNLYSEQKNSSKAIDYYRKTNHLAVQLGNLNLQRIALSNIGSEYVLLNKLDSALTYTQIAYKYALNLNVTDIQIELMILANIYKRMNHFEQALKYYRKSIPASIAVKNDRTLSQTYLDIAEVLSTVQKVDSAIVYAKQSLQLAQSAVMLTTVIKASKLLSELYEISNPRQALAYLNLASVAKDSLINEEKVKNFQNIEFNERMRQEDAQRLEEVYRTRMTMYALLGGIAALVLIALILYRNNRNKQKANGLLQKQRDEISVQRQKAENALTDLKSTQAQLIQREKLASLGELTAGIAHEIQNPLNFVNNFAEVSVELTEELDQSVDEGNLNLAKDLSADLRANMQTIAHNGQRASNIVRGMLEHSRASGGEKKYTNLNALADEHLRLAYQGQRAKSKNGLTGQFNIALQTDFDASLGQINIVAQDIGRVLLNVYNNAFYAVKERAKQAEPSYEPTVWVITQKELKQVNICVRDNGVGVPHAIQHKILQPFFTTKPTGEGTGLGLSLSYDIVTKGHGGDLEIVSQEGQGTTVTIRLPL